MTTEKQVSITQRLRNSFEYRTGLRLGQQHDHPKHSLGQQLPDQPEELQASDLFKDWWYYSIELLPGLITRGIYAPDLPMLPRMMLRRCLLNETSCLDVGTMEGLIPVLMRRGGARQVLAVDGLDHRLAQLEAVKHYYDVDFDYKTVGPLYDLAAKLGGRGFDLINYSGILYHVFSPLMALGGIRPLLKRGGYMIVSTNVVVEEGYFMEFNNAGRMQSEAGTFWYISVELLDYLLRYLRLAPMDCLFLPHTSVRSDRKYVFNKPSGYLSVLCRAVDEVLPTRDDEWMAWSAQQPWEYHWNIDWGLAARQPLSGIESRGSFDNQFFRRDVNCLDLWKAVQNTQPLTSVEESDSHVLRLSDKL
ncbi:MAG: tRNA (mo5U34)-methyltransferase [Blastocatellia bacterium]|nr:tRNA (mo5U34)-methyltransferase [Blastocatellia bacterium]